MPDKVEKRRNFLINLMFLIVVLALVYVFFRYLFWVTAPFVLTFFFAIILQRPLRWLDKKTNKKMHTFWSIFLIVISLAIIVGPISFLISAIISKLAEFVKYLSGLISDLPNFLTTLENEVLNFGKFLPEGIYNSYCETITNTFTKLLEQTSASEALGVDLDTIKNGVTTGISGVYGVVKNIPSILIGVVIGIIAWIFFTKDYNYIVRFIQKQFPEGKKNLLVEIKQVFTKTILKMFKAYGLIMCITFFELFLGFSILRMLGIMQNSYFVWIAVGIAIFDILPVAGSGGILIPWALFSLVMGNYKQAIGLIIIYAVITVIRQYIEPKIVGESLGVHPIITLMGLYFGLKLFGFIGMFVVPISIMTLKAFNDTGRIQIWKSSDRK
ncbi:MAG: sporulation integral membrane protein YtvI [Eubacterium sp.]